MYVIEKDFSMTIKKYGVVVIAIAVTVVSIFYTSSSTRSQSYSKKIALILPAVHPSMEAIQNGCIETLKTLIPDAHVTVYNANGNKTLLKGQAEKIVRHKYDGCCAIGTNASTMMATILEKNQSAMPLVAIAVAPEVAERLNALYRYVTGVTDRADKTEQVEVLLQLKKIKKPVLVYDPGSNPGFEADKKEYENLFKKHGITLFSIPVYSIQEVYQKLSGTIASYDLVLTLTDHTVCAAMDALIKLCNQHGVTLYTSELDSNDKGAVLSYGVKEREYGVAAAGLLQKVYTTNEKVPFVQSGPFYLKINKETALRQNLTIPENNSILGVAVIYGGLNA